MLKIYFNIIFEYALFILILYLLLILLFALLGFVNNQIRIHRCLCVLQTPLKI